MPCGSSLPATPPARPIYSRPHIDISWQIDAYHFALPLMASGRDWVVSPATASAIGRLGGLGVLNLEGLWTRYEDPTDAFAEIAELPGEKATRRMQEIYLEPIKPDLIGQRVKEMKSAGVTTAASLTPQRVPDYAHLTAKAGLDILVVQGTVVSAEHVSTRTE